MAGFLGCVGSCNCTHITMERCEYFLKNNHLGPKSSHTTGTFNLTCNQHRRILHLAGNVGVVLGIFSSQNDRHADMSAPCRRHDTDHVGDIAPCQLAGRRVGVVSARVNCDVSAPCRRPWAPSTTPSPAAHASPAPDPPIRACSFHHLRCRVRSVCSEPSGKFTFSLV